VGLPGALTAVANFSRLKETATDQPRNLSGCSARLVVIALSVIDLILGFKAFTSPDGTINSVPFFMPFFIATITALAAVGDVRRLRLGTLPAAPRLARHLWRMCFALFMECTPFSAATWGPAGQ